jgi:hypothetical protein
MRNYCDHEKSYILKAIDLHILSTPKYEEVAFGILSICLYVCIYGYVSCYCLNSWLDVILIQYLRVYSLQMSTREYQNPSNTNRGPRQQNVSL